MNDADRKTAFLSEKQPQRRCDTKRRRAGPIPWNPTCTAAVILVSVVAFTEASWAVDSPGIRWAALFNRVSIGVQQAEEDDSWQTFHSPEGGFRIDLPGQPLEQSRTFKPNADDEIEMKMFLVNAERGQVVVVVGYHDLITKPNGDQAINEVLQGGMQGALVNVDGDLEHQESIEFNDSPGRYFRFTGQQGNREIRGSFWLILRENRVYQLSVMQLASADWDPANTQKFFSSFEYAEIKPASTDRDGDDRDPDKNANADSDNSDQNRRSR